MKASPTRSKLLHILWCLDCHGVQPYFKVTQHNLHVKRDKSCCLKGLATVLLCKNVEKRVFEGRKDAFLVAVEDALACQVSDALGVLAL
jgi:hypothetical protein